VRARGTALVAGACIALLAGCGSGGGDNPALSVPEQPTSAASVPGGGPPISVVTLAGTQVEYPQLGAGGDARAINAALAAQAASLKGKACGVRIVGDTARIVSFRTVCKPSLVVTANFDVATGRELKLDDVFMGDYLSALSSSAVDQLTAGGVASGEATRLAAPDPASFATWALSPTSLEVTFEPSSGPVTVSFPLSGLSGFLRRPL